MRYIFLFFLIFLTSFAQSQQQSFSVSYGIGYTIPNHPRFPETKSAAQYIDFVWSKKSDSTRYFSIFFNDPEFNLSGSVMSFGNNKDLGFAYAVIPSLSFSILKYKKLNATIEAGLGIAYLNKTFSSFNNPSNIAIGTSINANAHLKFELSYRLRKIQPFVKISAVHFSNGNAMAPNLGINSALFQTGIKIFCPKEKESTVLKKRIEDLPAFRKRWSASIHAGLGISSNISRGPFFPVYLIAAAANWQYSRTNLLAAGLEYSFNSSVYEFYQNNSSANIQRKNFDRYLLWASHEWIFGNFGFRTLGGLYLNKHANQKSIIATEVGINYYPKLPYKYPKNQICIGTHIRAYFGLAEFVMMQVGFRF